MPTFSTENPDQYPVDTKPEVSEWVATVRGSLGLESSNEGTSLHPRISLQLASDAIKLLIGPDSRIENDQDVLYSLMGTIIKCGNPGSRLLLVEKLDALANISAVSGENKTDEDLDDQFITIGSDEGTPRCRYGHPITSGQIFMERKIRQPGLSPDIEQKETSIPTPITNPLAGKPKPSKNESRDTIDTQTMKAEDPTPNNTDNEVATMHSNSQFTQPLSSRESSLSLPSGESRGDGSPDSNDSEELFRTGAVYTLVGLLSENGQFNECQGPKENAESGKGKCVASSSGQGTEKAARRNAPTRKKRRPEEEPGDGEGDGDGNQPPHDDSMESLLKKLKNRFACPYAKGEPESHKKCWLINRQNLAGVKEHLKRNHSTKNLPDLTPYRTWISLFDLCFPKWGSKPKPSPEFDTNELAQQSNLEKKKRRIAELEAQISTLESILEGPDIKNALSEYRNSLRQQVEAEKSSTMVLQNNSIVEHQVTTEQQACNEATGSIVGGNTPSMAVADAPPQIFLGDSLLGQCPTPTTSTGTYIYNNNIPTNGDCYDLFGELMEPPPVPLIGFYDQGGTVNQWSSDVSNYSGVVNTPGYGGTSGEWHNTPGSLVTSRSSITSTRSQPGGALPLHTLSIQRIPRGFGKLDSQPPETLGPKEYYFKSFEEFNTTFDSWLGAVFTNPPFSWMNAALVNVRTECTLHDTSAVWQDIQHTFRATSQRAAALDLVFQG